MVGKSSHHGDRTLFLNASVMWHRWQYVIACLASILFLSRLSPGNDILWPEVNPSYQIEITAEEIAKETRGAYEVLAFTGRCQLSQGGLTATAQEIILWIEKSLPDEPNQPGKIICALSGDVRLNWGEKQSLQDDHWMGRLYSLYPVRHQTQREVRRFDIPHLDWSREQLQVKEAGGPVNEINQLRAQSPRPKSTLLNPIQPRLLEVSDRPSPNQPTYQGGLPATHLGSPQARLASGSANTINGDTSGVAIEPTPGAITWEGNLTSRGSTGLLLPNSGLAFPDSGGLPYPATSRGPATISVAPTYGNGANSEYNSHLQGSSGLITDSNSPLNPQLSRQIPSPNPFGVKSVQFFQRNSGSRIEIRPDAASGQTVAEVRGGFRLVVSGIQVIQPDGSLLDFGTVSLEADNAIIWLHGQEASGNLFSGLTSTPEQPIEMYLDGNIVFSQGNRVIYADRMYYNISSEYGMVLSAEMLTPIPQYQGLLRLKADVLQQQDRRTFRAFGAAVTSSRMGLPRYWLQSREVEVSDQRTEENLSVFSPTQRSKATDIQVSSRSNFVYLSGIPVLYWPSFSTDLSDPSFYLTSAKVGNDKIFGTQVYLDWDIYQLLGIRGIQGTRWRVSTNYLSERGFSLGNRFEYDRPTWLFGAPGVGFSDAWFIDDSGQDFLGRDRTNLTPEATLRGRVLSRHRIHFSPNVELIGETGWISDRNFLEQFFENEWDQQKDLDTALRLRRYNRNKMFEVFGQARVNRFFTETEWLPRFNHYWLGQDLFAQRFTWNANSSVAYANQRTASTPQDPIDAAKFALLDWESNSEGLRAITRQELSLPLNLGAFKFVPYIGGEAGFWNQDINQQEVTRVTGQAGIRTSLPFWSVNPNVENRLLDLRGLSHKVNLRSDIFAADTNQDLNRFPLYDPLDDNSQEHFRRRFIFDTFGGVLPERFDERNYAVRSGMQRWVTAGSSEVVDNTQQARFGIDQRWQTKRGMPGRERIVDLMSLDFDFIYFPRADKDNFGEDIGGLNYGFRYHIGDRLTLLSDGYADVFSQGLKTISVGANISRPGRGDGYIGVLSIEGPISASILNGNVNYRLNEKWIISSGAAYDFGQAGFIGQSFGLTRIGESALIRLGLNVDPGRENVSLNFNIEPRFFPTQKLGELGGQLIPPAGLFGVE